MLCCLIWSRNLFMLLARALFDLPSFAIASLFVWLVADGWC
jgi:hypothetical protein